MLCSLSPVTNAGSVHYSSLGLEGLIMLSGYVSCSYSDRVVLHCFLGEEVVDEC